MAAPSGASALTRLASATQRRENAQRAADDADQEWREMIRTAVAAGARVTEVAMTAGISRERVYQIKDGRR